MPATAHAISVRNDQELPSSEENATFTVDSDIQEGEGLTQQQYFSGKSSEALPLEQPTRLSGRVKSPTENEKRLYEMVTSPFPERFKKQIEEGFEAVMEDELQELEARMPLAEAIKMLCPLKGSLKERALNTILGKRKQAAKSKECKALTEKLIIVQEKIEDLGSFTLPCPLNQTVSSNSLCNLEASLHIMPSSTAKKPGYDNNKPSKLSLMFADKTIKRPCGLLEKYPIRVERVEVPTDFMVLKTNEESRDPLILPRPFLASAGDVIDTKNEKIDLHLGSDLVLKLGVDSAAKKPTIDGQLFSLKVMDHLFDPPFKEPPKKVFTQNVVTEVEEVGDPKSKILRLEEDIAANDEGSEETRVPDSTPWSSQTPMCLKTPSLMFKLQVPINSVKTALYDYSSSTINSSNRAENELTSQLEEMKLQILELKSNGNRSSPKKVIMELSVPGKSRAFNIATTASSLHYPPKLFHMESPVPLYDPPPD